MTDGQAQEAYRYWTYDKIREAMHNRIDLRSTYMDEVGYGIKTRKIISLHLSLPLSLRFLALR